MEKLAMRDNGVALMLNDLPDDWFEQHAYVVGYNVESKKMEVYGMGSYIDTETGQEYQGTEKLGDWELSEREEFFKYLRRILGDDFILWCAISPLAAFIKLSLAVGDGRDLQSALSLPLGGDL